MKKMRNLFSKIYYSGRWLKLKARNLTWRMLFCKFGKGSNVFGNITVYYPENIELGSNSTLNQGVLLNARDKITIGNHVHISPYCIINTAGLDYTKTMSERIHILSPIIIEDGVWIGSGAIINPGVKIGKNAVVGAGAVVIKNVPENTIAVGVPAKELKKI